MRWLDTLERQARDPSEHDHLDGEASDQSLIARQQESLLAGLRVGRAREPVKVCLHGHRPAELGGH